MSYPPGDGEWQNQQPPPSAPPPPSALPPPPNSPPPAAWGQAGPYQQYPSQMMVNPYDARSTTPLILGILGLVFCQILAPIAWVQGNSLRDEAQGAGYPEPANGKIGRILGIVGTALMAAYLVFGILWIVVFAAAASSSGY